MPFVGEFGPFLNSLKGREGRAKGRMVGVGEGGVSGGKARAERPGESGQLQEERLE